MSLFWPEPLQRDDSGPGNGRNHEVIKYRNRYFVSKCELGTVSKCSKF